MEVERERFAAEVVGKTANNKAIVGPEHKVGPTEKFEFGVPGDEIAKVIGGGYQSLWNPDFLQKELGKDGTCARFFFDKKVVLDVGDPDSSIVKMKRRLCFKNGFGYLCVPVGFQKNEEKLRELYQSSLEEYRQYEKLHPRPAMIQETVFTDEKGNIRRAFLTAIDIKVGGGMTGNVETQRRELMEAEKLSKKELRSLKNNAKLRRKVRECLQSGAPFRNPFIAPDKRQFNVQYGEK